LRRNRANKANLHRFSNYYKVNNIPFDMEKGFEVSGAKRNNPVWAHRHGLNG
jgi:hypothetical protein